MLYYVLVASKVTRVYAVADLRAAHFPPILKIMVNRSPGTCTAPAIDIKTLLWAGFICQYDNNPIHGKIAIKPK